MKTFRSAILSLLLCAYCGMLHAQTRSLQFEDELCTYKGYYNAKKYTEKQLLDTYRLVNWMGAYVDVQDGLLEMEKQYTENTSELIALTIVDEPYFQVYRDSILHYEKESYRMKVIEAQAKEHPEELSRYFMDDPLVKRYALALQNGGEQLYQAYETLTKEQMKNNGAPQRLWNRYQANMAKPNKAELAFAEVLVYGWWNSVNDNIAHLHRDGSQFLRFQKLFVKIDTLDCDEP